MTRLGVITGLAREAACLDTARSTLEGVPTLLVAAAFGPDAAERAARDLVERGALGLASFGTAGGLDPALGPGSVILPEAVVAAGERRFATDPAWREALRGCLGRGLHQGILLGVEAIVAGPAAKARLAAKSGAQAVDMESHAVARVAAEARLPFLAARAIADPAGRGIPAAALRALGSNGEIRPLGVLCALLMHPWEVAAVARVASDERAALRSLRRVAAAAPLLGFGLRESLLDV